MAEKIKIAFIGAGNVATALALALKEAGAQVLQVYNRSAPAAKELAQKLDCTFTTNLAEISTEADIYIVCVKDAAIAEVAAHISLSPKMLVHTGGAIATDALAPASENYGVFYPLQTFSKGRQPNLGSVPFCIEASNPHMLQVLRQLAQMLGGTIVETTFAQRMQLHVAAVFTNNFTNYLLGHAQQIMQQANLPFNLLKPLAEETIAKAFEMGAEKAQTGPAIREDKNTIERHMQLMENNAAARHIYELLSEAISTKK